MKRFFSSTWIVLSLAIMAFAPTLSLVASSEVSAGSPALQQIVDDIRSTCKDMNQDGDTWKDCEDKQNKLALFAGCSDKMFGAKDASGKRSFEKSKLDDCQKKINNKKEVPRRAQEMLDFITAKCSNVQDARGAGAWLASGGFTGMLGELATGHRLIDFFEGTWKNCEGMQNELTTIGCSGNMFETTSSNIIEKRWSYIKSETDACQGIINQIKTSPNTKPGEGADPDDPSGTGGDNIPCRGGPMGWLMCPLIEIMSEALQTIAGFIDSMMQFRLLSQTNSQDALRNVWQTFLNIANIFLAIAFLVIIFSQTTSVGLSNYGIKRMLPRLIMGAILMNLSFYICAFAVDISNIVGNSVMGLFANMTDIAHWNYADSDGVVKAAFTDKSGADGLGTGFVKYLGAGIAAVVIILFFLVPVLLSALLVFIVLVARQVIITVLVVVAPLAFVAWLLPNTEQYFKKWWSTFSQMLFAYPMVMAVFGAAIFVAELIQGVNQVNSKVGAAEIGGPGIISAIVPLVVLAIPLFAIPKLIMSTNAIMGKVGSAANGFINKAGGDWAKKAYGEGRKNVSKRAGMRMANNSWTEEGGVKGRVGRAGRWVGGSGARRRGRKANREEDAKRVEEGYMADYYEGRADKDPLRAARAVEAKSKRGKEETSAHETLIATKMAKRVAEAQATGKEYDEIAGLEAELKAAAGSGNMEQMKAAQNLLISKGSGGVERMRNISADPSLGASVHQALSGNLNSNHRNTIEEKDPELLNYLDTSGAEGAKSAGAYDKLTPEGVGKLTDDAFNRALRSGDVKVDQQILAAAGSDAALSKMGAKRQEAVKTRAAQLGGGNP